jgi:hypothetical protein
MAVLRLVDRPGPKPEDLTGKQFGLLTVLGQGTVHPHYGYRWRARCECGVEIERFARDLQRKPKGKGKWKQSCGCLRKRLRSPKYRGVGDLSSTKFRGIKAKAKHRGIAFRVTIKFAWDLFVQQGKRCALTGLPITLHPSSVEEGANTASLDRIDSSKGYTKDNVQWVHTAINFMKHSLSEAEFVRLCCLVAWHKGAEFGTGTPDAPWMY